MSFSRQFALICFLLLGGCAGIHQKAGTAPVGFGPRNRYDRQDRPQGRWRTYYDSARTLPYTAGRYRHGRPIKTFSYYAPTGRLDRSEEYGRDGFCVVRYWYPSGKLARQGRAQWLTGSKGARFYWFGPWFSLAEQGDTTALDTYTDGKHTARIGFENGKRATWETYDQLGHVQSSQRLALPK